MKVNVQWLGGKDVTLDVEATDSVDSFRQKFIDAEGLGDDDGFFVYAGKQLEAGRTLRSYHIQNHATLHFILRPRGGNLQPESVFPAETSFLKEQQVRQNFQELSAIAQRHDFQPDIALVNPGLHDAYLATVEQDVVRASAWYRCRGSYTDYRPDLVGILFTPGLEMPTAPSWMVKLISGIKTRSDHPFNQALLSIREIYPLLCRLLGNFESLQVAGFCKEFYSVILEHDGKNVAEIVKITRVMLEELKMSIEVTVAMLCDEGSPPYAPNDHPLQFIEEACDSILKVLHISPSRTRQSDWQVLSVCRSISLLLDLGLVSYAGSHASRFDLDHLQKDIGGFGVDEGDGGFAFICKKRRLACLDEFLNHEEIWSFRCSYGQPFFPQDKLQDAPMLILTHIEEFADIWGPVYSLSKEAETGPGLIKQHNLSNGIICRVAEKPSHEYGAIRCHWYGFDSHQRKRNDQKVPSSRALTLTMDDLLLIGARFRDNQACVYTLNEFESTYGHDLGILGTERSIWELQEREVGLSFNKVIGIQISGTQKRRPQTTLKQCILAKWKMDPQTANPAILNQYLGVEVSHCTGNARRVPIKHLLLMPVIQSLLGLQFPGWMETSWGQPFRTAILSTDLNSIFKVWSDHSTCRYQIGALVSYVLELLDKTGARQDGLVAGFLNGQQESSVTIGRHRNDWSHLLTDSHLSAAYVMVNNRCIECYTPDHSTAICGDKKAHTVFDTRLAVEWSRLEPTLSPGRIKVEPCGQVLKTLNRVGPGRLLMQPSSLVSNFGAKVLSNVFDNTVVVGKEVRDLGAKGGQQYQVYLSSSENSYGGMKEPRVRTSNKLERPNGYQDESQSTRQRTFYDAFGTSSPRTLRGPRQELSAQRMPEYTMTSALRLTPSGPTQVPSPHVPQLYESTHVRNSFQDVEDTSSPPFHETYVSAAQSLMGTPGSYDRNLNVSSFELPTVSYEPMDWSFDNITQQQPRTDTTFVPECPAATVVERPQGFRSPIQTLVPVQKTVFKTSNERQALIERIAGIAASALTDSESAEQNPNPHSKIGHRKMDCNVSSVELPSISFDPMDWSFENNDQHESPIGTTRAPERRSTND